MQNIFEHLGLIAAIILPFWNIPLILKIIKRKSSRDISLAWAVGVWVCVVLMAPSGFKSQDIVWRTYNIFNVILFTAVFLRSSNITKESLLNVGKNKKFSLRHGVYRGTSQCRQVDLAQ